MLVQKGIILSRGKNKAGMIALISTARIKRVCYVVVSPGDADVEIEKATVDRSRHSIILIGEDTDLLILPLHFSVRENKTINFRSDVNSKRNAKCILLTLLKNF
ncbi:hypothetical protein DPMN_088950 [Dreissena polymorpha]|uniref:Uncharacterized protein n=1 Tax=Dreissena polymorpha TaxID=45954 RepID=A0A9D4KVX5_DREPO|nr:hypothetical protein DPMN_088950 [Dreissena polymorpha]